MYNKISNIYYYNIMSQEYIVFFMGLASLCASIMVFVLKICFKSKCDQVNCCWGCLNVHRNTAQESQTISNSELQLPSRVSPATLPV